MDYPMKRDLRLSVVAALSVLLAGYIVALVYIFQIQPLLHPISTLGYLLIVGIAGRLLFVGSPRGITTMFRKELIGDLLVLIAAGVLAIRLTGLASAGLALSTNDVIVGGMAALCESWFVHGCVQTGIIRLFDMGGYNLIGNAFGILGGAGVACLLHWYIYGTMINALVYVAGAFAILCVGYWLSGERLEVPIIVHVIINLFR